MKKKDVVKNINKVVIDFFRQDSEADKIIRGCNYYLESNSPYLKKVIFKDILISFKLLKERISLIDNVINRLGK